MLQMMDDSPDHAEHEQGGDRMYNGHHHEPMSHAYLG